MAKMQIATRDRPRVKTECLRLLATLRLNPARTQLLAGFIDSYLRLNAREQKLFEQEVAALAPPAREATVELMTSWEEKGLQRGLEQGEQREAGAMTLRLMRRRFGSLPEALEQRVIGLPKTALEDLAESLFDFTTLADVDDWLAQRD